MSKRNIGKEIIEGLEELKAWRQGKVSAKLKMTRSSGNVFLDVGFPPAEAGTMMLRAQLMSRVRDAARGTSQGEAARRLGINQPRLNDVLRGRIDKFSLDALVNMLAHAGMRVELRVKKAA
jgi:predicted XRE-type DNA-binding protein